jgi:hypothetical protein
MEITEEEPGTILGFVVSSSQSLRRDIKWLARQFQFVCRATRRCYERYLQPEILRQNMTGDLVTIGLIHSTDALFGRLWRPAFLSLLYTPPVNCWRRHFIKNTPNELRAFLIRMMLLPEEHRPEAFSEIWLACHRLALSRKSVTILGESQDWEGWEKILLSIRKDTHIIEEELRKTLLSESARDEIFACLLTIPLANGARPLGPNEIRGVAYEWFVKTVADCDLWLVPETAFQTLSGVNEYATNQFTQQQLDEHWKRFFSTHVSGWEDWQLVLPFYQRLKRASSGAVKDRLFTNGLVRLIQLSPSYDDQQLQQACLSLLTLGKEALCIDDDLKILADLLCLRGLRSFFLGLFTKDGVLPSLGSVVRLLPEIDDVLYTGEPLDLFIQGGSLAVIYTEPQGEMRLKEYLPVVKALLEEQSDEEFMTFLQLAASFIPPHQWEERIGSPLCIILKTMWSRHLTPNIRLGWCSEEFHRIRKIRLVGQLWDWFPEEHRDTLKKALDNHLSQAQIALSREPWLCDCCGESYQKCLAETCQFCLLRGQWQVHGERARDLLQHYDRLCTIRNTSLFTGKNEIIMAEEENTDDDELLQQDWSSTEEEEEEDVIDQ